MSRKLFALLLLGLTAGTLSAAEPSAGKSAKKPRPPAEQVTRPEELLPRTVFGVLLGELALQRGKFDIALGAYVDLARRTQDARLQERAFEIAMNSRQIELALELARQWSQRDPESIKARLAITTALMLLNRTDELGEHIARMLEADKPRLADNLMHLNRLLARQTDRQTVSQLIQKVASPYSDLPEAHYAMGLAALSAGDQALARSASAQALTMRPDWERAALLRAQVLAKDSAGEALLLLQDFVAAQPQAADARLSLARLLLSEKRERESRQQFERVLEMYPESPEALFPAAMLALRQNDPAAGRKHLERLLAGPYQDKGTVQYFLGQIAEDEKQFELALKHYRQVDAGEHYLGARLRMAVLMTQAGQEDAALKMLAETRTMTAEEKAQLAMGEAILLRDSKRYAESYARLERELKTQPDHPRLLYDAAMAAERNGRFDLLERHLQHLLKLDPKNAHALNALGYTLADRNLRLDEAHQLISKALELTPNDPFIMDSLGWALYRQGKLAEALVTLQAAYKLREDPEIAAHLGEVLWMLERRDEARAIWQSAAQKHPDNEALSAVIKKFIP